MLKNNFSKEMKKLAKELIKAYPEFQRQICAYEASKNMLGIIDEEAEATYNSQKAYTEVIEDTFNNTVKEELQKKVWNYLINKRAVEDFEENLVKEEIEKWTHCLAVEMGFVANDKRGK